MKCFLVLFVPLMIGAVILILATLRPKHGPPGEDYEKLAQVCKQRHLAFRVTNNSVAANAIAWDADYTESQANDGLADEWYAVNWNHDTTQAVKTLLERLKSTPNSPKTQPFDTGEVRP